MFFDDVGEVGVNPNAKMDQGWLDTFGLAPTFVVETSKDNFQYFYGFNEPVAPIVQQALAKAFKANPDTRGGFKDGNDIVRYGRLPSGGNLKKEKAGFRTSLVEASGRKYSVDELVQGFRLKLGAIEPRPDPNGPSTHERVLDVDPTLRVALVRQAVAAIVNDLDRTEWIYIAHAIEGALDGDPEAEPIFLGFTARRTEGESDPAKDQNTWARAAKGIPATATCCSSWRSKARPTPRRPSPRFG